MRSASQGYLANKGTKAAVVSCVLFWSARLLHRELGYLPLQSATRLQVRHHHNQYASNPAAEVLNIRRGGLHGGGNMTLVMGRAEHGQLIPYSACSGRCTDPATQACTHGNCWNVAGAAPTPSSCTAVALSVDSSPGACCGVEQAQLWRAPSCQRPCHPAARCRPPAQRCGAPAP